MNLLGLYVLNASMRDFDIGRGLIKLASEIRPVYLYITHKSHVWMSEGNFEVKYWTTVTSSTHISEAANRVTGMMLGLHCCVH